MMPPLDTRALKELDDAFAATLEEFPELQRGFHEKAAAILKEEVDGAIGSTLGGDTRRIQDWQREHVGSGGGYAAVRPVGSKEGAPTGKNSPGAITSYINSGHAVRKPMTEGKKGRAKQAYVDGRHFYESAQVQVEARVLQEAESLVESLGRKLEGGG